MQVHKKQRKSTTIIVIVIFRCNLQLYLQRFLRRRRLRECVVPFGPFSGFITYRNPNPVKTFLLLTVAASAFISSSASAAIATFQQYGAWQFAVTNGILLPAPLSIITENFNAYSGSYSNRLVGSTGPIDWSAAAVSNVPIATNIVANSGWLSTNGADENLVFSFAPLEFVPSAGTFSPEMHLSTSSQLLLESFSQTVHPPFKMSHPRVASSDSFRVIWLSLVCKCPFIRLLLA